MVVRTAVLLTGAFVVCLGPLAWAADFQDLKSANWHQWRGPEANGTTPDGNPPVTWSETENIQWKVKIEGLGNSTPIVWQDRVFLTTAINTKRADPTLTPPDRQPERPFGITYPNTFHQFVVLCLDRNSGNEIWRRVATRTVPQEGHHGDNSFATASPTTDGERLYVWFGIAGMYCFDLDGTQLWQRDLGPVKTRLSFGEGASPVVHNDRVIVVRDHDEQSSITVLNCSSGDTVWQMNRDEPSGWATPLVVDRAGKIQVITNGKNRVRSYDLVNGKLIWECDGQVSNVTPSPVASERTVFCMSGYRGSALYAIPIDASGDISNSDAIAWKKSRGTPYVPSPLLYRGNLYFNQSNTPIMTSLNAGSGDAVITRIRLPGIRGLYSSPVAAAGRVYFTGRDGTTVVLKHGNEFNILAKNILQARIDASPAIAGSQLFLRGKSHLYCIAAKL